METKAPDEIADAICAFVIEQDRPVLFTGAGLSEKVGLPGWDEYIHHLASVCEAYDANADARLIRARLEQGNLTGAAAVYQTCNRIPKGERLQKQSAPFRVDRERISLGALENIARLDFTAFVTTNYDNVLHHTFASARSRSAQRVELDDGTLRGAANSRSFFIARIHGRAEVPSSMVLGEPDYDRLREDDSYLDFLISILSQRNCLFVGFSFLDPAISHVLRAYEKRVGPAYPELHRALLPDDVEGDLVRQLLEYNIDVTGYDPGRDHRDLWEAFRQARKKCADQTEDDKPTVKIATEPKPSLKRYLAFLLVKTRTEGQHTAVRKMVESAIVRSALHEHGGSAARSAIKREIRETLRFDEEEAERLCNSIIERMKGGGEITLRDDKVRLTERGSDGVDRSTEALNHLSDAVLDRMRVREGVHPFGAGREAAAEVIESVLLTRAWDLAAHYTGAAMEWGSDLSDVVHSAVARVARDHTIGNPTAMARATLDLLTAPDNEEASSLTELSKAAFALQLVLSNPRRALFHELPVPQRVYLDANILMPAITPGHPYRPAYIDTIKQLRKLASQQDRSFQLMVGRPFLEEIVEHRRKAIERVDKLDLSTRSNLGRHVSFYGMTGVNVFIAGFASAVGRSVTGRRREVDFTEFIDDAAPYSSEAELTDYLDGLGIKTVNMSFGSGDFSADASKFFSYLLSGYETIGPSPRVEKDKVLIEHESLQLLQLQADESGNSLFATADLKLQRAISQSPRLSHLSSRVVTHLGLITLVEVLSGLTTDTQSYARLVWGIPEFDYEEKVREYLIDEALREYEPAMAMETPELAERIAHEAVIEAEAEGVNWSDDSTEDLARTARFLDRFEERFFKKMRKAMERDDL